jgi:hypothetical protein
MNRPGENPYCEGYSRGYAGEVGNPYHWNAISRSQFSQGWCDGQADSRRDAAPPDWHPYAPQVTAAKEKAREALAMSQKIQTNLLGTAVLIRDVEPHVHQLQDWDGTPIHPRAAWGQRGVIRSVYLLADKVYYTLELPDGTLLDTLPEFFTVVPEQA